MQKKIKVIKIDGFKGLITAAGVCVCLFAGFIVFPGKVMKFIWNFLSVHFGIIPPISLFQGTLLWGIVFLSYLIIKRRDFSIGFKSAEDLSQEELDKVMQKIQMEYQPYMAEDILPKIKELEKKLQNDINNSEKTNS